MTAARTHPSSTHAKLRAQFPVCARHAYLNAGTNGPLAERTLAAMRAELERELAEGRTAAGFTRRGELADRLRARYAKLLGAAAEEVSLTTCTSEGLFLVLAGFDLPRGAEIVTSDQEHPGLLGALQALRDLRGAKIQMAPFERIADAVGPRTRLVVCSHVSWVSGRLAPRELAQLGGSVPLVLDGAQGVGALPTDVHELHAAAYAGAGQKWLCGPDGIGMLYVRPELRERLATVRRGYGNFSEANRGLEATLHEDARRFDSFALGAPLLAGTLAALDVLEEEGLPQLQSYAIALAGKLKRSLEQLGRVPAADDQTTLVSFSSPDPAGEHERLAAAGAIVREIPGHELLRASVGAWNNHDDLERLLQALL
jgi:selenocysteine lyase/cysteine desulfurase